MSKKQVFLISSFVFLIFNTFTLKPKKFEGTIFYMKRSKIDTFYMKFYIKDYMLRIDKFSEKMKLITYEIYNFNKQELKIVKPQKKSFIIKKIEKRTLKHDPNIVIAKTGNYKNINNYKCYQWIVKNKAKNSMVSYWVTDYGYNYYNDYVSMMNNTDKISSYFLQVPNNSGFVPLCSTEQSWLRDFRVDMSASSVNEHEINERLFEIPKDYQIFE